MFFITEWKRLRTEIRAAPARARRLDEEITEALYRYRIHLTELQAKPHLLDRKIWETVDAILEDLRELKEDSQGRLLHRPSTLARILERWKNLFQKQQELLVMIDETMERSEFYNKMETAKRQKGREEAQRAKAESKLSKARRDLIQAIHYTLLRERSGESITADSVVLDLDRAIDQWEVRLQQALSPRESETSTEEQIRFLGQLRQQILDAPVWAEKLKAVEEDLDELLTLEDQLRAITGRGQLAEADIDEMIDLLRIDAPDSWARSEWDTLESIIHRIQAYVQREYGPLQSELYVRRKRNGKAFTEPHPPPSVPAGGADEHRADQAEPLPEPTGQRATYFGSLVRAIRSRPRATPNARTFIDPDADEAIRRAFEHSERTNDKDGE